MNKSILSPSEVNGIYRAVALLIQQTIPSDDHTEQVQGMALADLADRLGEWTRASAKTEPATPARR